MLWVTMFALVLSVALLFYRAKRRRGYKPFICGVGAAIFIISGKFIVNINFIFYAGVILLILASIWNSWPRKKQAQSLSIPS